MLRLSGLFAALPLLLGAQAGPQTQAAPAANSDPRPVLIELFTSEGCSSCPPADIILQRLDDYQPITGAQLIVLSEHVTYWDHDGWKDPNSSPALTDRQSSYETALGEKESFTPQFVVDGNHEVHIEHIDQMEDVLNKAKDEPTIPIRIADVKVDPADPTVLRAHIDTGANAEKRAADVYVAVALNHVESQVLKGENGGRHLVHVAVVQQLTKVGKLPKGKTFDQEVQLKLKPGTDLKNIRVVAFIQESGPGKTLGAALRKSAL
ncbi:MAG TPA: DUF1223 domain-containing protein [Candidatus Sulfotelmatobacter sp.]|nr:DUF1223 domain-containing protein [Candidatus Sulfotelmatobacter sp.]